MVEGDHAVLLGCARCGCRGWLGAFYVVASTRQAIALWCGQPVIGSRSSASSSSLLFCPIGSVVTCPRHGARFDVCTGEALCLPAVAATPVHRIRTRDGNIEVEVEVED